MMTETVPGVVTQTVDGPVADGAFAQQIVDRARAEGLSRTVRSLLYSTVTTGDTTDPALDRPNRFIDKNWAESQEYAATLPAAGWQYTAIRCRALGGFDFLALKDYGDFTAAMSGTYDRRTANLSVQIPFHSEPFNPWQPAETIELKDTCLNADKAPDSDGEKTNSNYQVRGVE